MSNTPDSSTCCTTLAPLALTTLLILSAWPSAAAAQSAAIKDNTPRLTQESFSQPDATRPKTRWWLPLGPLQHVELERELQEIAEAGYSGVEILGTALTPSMPLEQHGFATAAWNQAMRDILVAAKARNLTVDFTIGAVYPAATPALEPDDLATSQELVYGSSEFEGEFDSALPGPIVPPAQGVQKRRLVGVSVARVTAAERADSVSLVPESLRDVTSQVTDGRLRWRAPSSGKWIVVASYARSAGHIVPNVTGRPSRVVDHFGASGTDAIIRLWDTQLLTPEIRTLIRQAGGDVFEDSLHLQGFTLWTDQLLSEFERRRGYSLRPFLPVLYIPYLNDFFHGLRSGPPGADLTIETPAAFDLADGEGQRIRNGYYQVLSELYTERHLQPLRSWFNRQGLRYRVQTSYGQSLEGTAAAASVDVPETESFQLNDMVDGYRVQSAVAHLTGQRIYSTECCAVMGAHMLSAGCIR
jgi:alpha-L-rhamnosidase